MDISSSLKVKGVQRARCSGTLLAEGKHWSANARSQIGVHRAARSEWGDHFGVEAGVAGDGADAGEEGGGAEAGFAAAGGAAFPDAAPAGAEAPSSGGSGVSGASPSKTSLRRRCT